MNKPTITGRSVVIDGLAHITASGVWLNGKTDASCARLLREMDASHVTFAIVTAIHDRIPNDDVATACHAHPDRLIGFASPSMHGADDPATVVRRSKDRGFFGIKLHPRFGRFQVDDAVLRPIVETAVELNMPVMLCGLADAREMAYQPLPHQMLGVWADMFPEHTFILAHAGSHRIMDAWAMARNRENVFLDLSHTLHYFRGSSVEMDIGFVARRLDRRVLFGSDFPESSIGDALGTLDHYLDFWPDADCSAIRGGTWMQILARHEWTICGSEVV